MCTTAFGDCEISSMLQQNHDFVSVLAIHAKIHQRMSNIVAEDGYVAMAWLFWNNTDDYLHCMIQQPLPHEAGKVLQVRLAQMDAVLDLKACVLT